MLLSDNINALMEESGITNVDLGKALDLSDETIRSWRKGAKIPTVDKLLKLAEYFGVSLDDLMGRQLNTERMIQLPLVGAVNAGLFSIENEEEWKDRFCSVSLRLLQGRPKKECCALEVVGESMQPLLMPGDIVIVHKQEHAFNGNIVIAYDPAEHGYTIKRFYRNGDTVILDPVNPQFDRLTYSRPSWKELNLYGVCVGMERKLV